MKHYLLAAASVLVLTAHAQKTDKTKIKYEIDMYPLETISKDKVVDINVKFDYADKVEAANAEIAAKQDQAAKEKAEYDKKGMGQKFLEKKVLGETKPTGVYINNDFIPTLFPVADVESLLNIPGFTKKDGAACNITASFAELSYTINAARTAVTYVPLKVTLSVVNDKGANVFQGDVPNNSTAITYTPTGSSNLGAGVAQTLKSIEMKAKDAAIANTNAFLKTNYGFNLVKDDCPFFDVKDKKQTYPEYHEAITKLETAFVSVNVPERQEKFVASLRECIAAWEGALKQLDKNDKAARINKDIAAATTLNLALAYTWIKEFDKAYDYLAEHKTLDEDYSRAYDDISKFLKDYSTRYNKYSKY